MPGRIDMELKSMERRLAAVHMNDSDRLVAMAAMRDGLIIVERFASLARGIAQLGATLFVRPGLARS